MSTTLHESQSPVPALEIQMLKLYCNMGTRTACSTSSTRHNGSSRSNARSGARNPRVSTRLMAQIPWGFDNATWFGKSVGASCALSEAGRPPALVPAEGGSCTFPAGTARRLGQGH